MSAIVSNEKNQTQKRITAILKIRQQTAVQSGQENDNNIRHTDTAPHAELPASTKNRRGAPHNTRCPSRTHTHARHLWTGWYHGNVGTNLTRCSTIYYHNRLIIINIIIFHLCKGSLNKIGNARKKNDASKYIVLKRLNVLTTYTWFSFTSE